MKKYMFYTVIVAFILLLGACEGKETKQDVITHVEEVIEKVESYHTDAELGIEMTDLSSKDVVQSYNGLVKTNLIEKSLEGSGEVIQDGSSFKFYTTEEGSYQQFEDEAWQDTTDQMENVNEATTLYAHIAQILADIKEEEDVKMEKKDGKYIFTFTGKSESIFKAFEDPYDLELTGATPGEVKQDMKIVIDNKTFFIKQIKNTLAVDIDGQRLQLFVNQQYEKINEIDEIKIPQEVVDEANEI